ncbi:winged helix-turn-helix transcriptional regulator [Oenococcus kitaharae]|uniref:Transcriptional regulator n=1 Tax=Oenococcus kitaharae DSM 17330 TaxID=1045004 RepID=G9WG34_9LACO|nr:helix-turn-helix domain-containing protein [Oenococcus kitaharae]EHN59612.1 Transcriptional regulator [Oenococcus kitaharae DSM 17330]MCV3295716.1 helix-turn-helix transcriptional regulator [Oenococcus kitaharae]OEY83456.1 transcriptional regulator [Oenococcus kitaharae]OEY85255.1 transcriptional regulator [Oenococcus kitaharae]OEY86109.1 transcriptional regulator [Oenococcus kitaharae]
MAGRLELTESAFEILGRKWNGLIIQTLLDSPDGSLHFTELSRTVHACSDRVLTVRLKELEDAGIIERGCCPDNGKFGYRLTEKGFSMRPLMSEISSWAANNI